VTPPNLLIRMSVVLQDEGSPALAAAVEANTLRLLQLFSEATNVHEMLERVDVAAALSGADATSQRIGMTSDHG
jgi:hypothetical protein